MLRPKNAVAQTDPALNDQITKGFEYSKAISSRKTIFNKEMVFSEEMGSSLKNHLWRVNWAKLGYPYVGVYCICPDNRWPTKVGVSQNVAKRLDGIQTGVWRSVDVFDYAWCQNAADAYAVEQKTHALMTDAALLMQGEWFDIRPDKAMEFVQFAAGILGIELRKDIPDEKVKDALYYALYRFSGQPKLSITAKEQKSIPKRCSSC